MHVLHALAAVAIAVAKWIAANPGWAAGVAMTCLAGINGILAHYGKAAGLRGLLTRAMDLLSFAVRRDSPGTWKPPLITWSQAQGFALSLSQPPVTNDVAAPDKSITDRQVISMRALLPLVALPALLALAGCTAQGCQAYMRNGGECEVKLGFSVVTQGIADLLAEVGKALAHQPVFQPDEWAQNLLTQGGPAVWDEIKCRAQHLVTDLDKAKVAAEEGERVASLVLPKRRCDHPPPEERHRPYLEALLRVRR